MAAPEALPASRLIDLREREKRVFSRSDLVDSSGRSLILPETRALMAVELRDTAEGISLQALGLIGYLPLTPSITLNLRPKFPIRNLWQMLSLADESYERVIPVLRVYESSSASAPQYMLARGFCHYLERILRSGLTKDYHSDTHEGYFRPKINFSGTVSKYLSRGDQVKTSSDVFTFSSRLRINGVLKSACLDFLRIIPRDRKWLRERALLIGSLNALDRVLPVRMNSGEHKLAMNLPTWSRGDYFGALDVYAVLLGFTGIGFLHEAQGSLLPSFLFKMDDIFESFVRNSLRHSFRDAAVSVSDGNVPRNHGLLFRDNKKFPIKPDIIIRKNKKGSIDAIAEVKYKERIEESDRYQVISHTVAAQSPIGIWISPALSEEDAGRTYVGEIQTGAKFYHYRLNISGDLNTARAGLANSIGSLISIKTRDI
jgi:5-methylcytosine-specific restriction enzyme subunit McrC